MTDHAKQLVQLQSKKNENQGSDLMKQIRKMIKDTLKRESKEIDSMQNKIETANTNAARVKKEVTQAIKKLNKTTGGNTSRANIRSGIAASQADLQELKDGINDNNDQFSKHLRSLNEKYMDRINELSDAITNHISKQN